MTVTAIKQDINVRRRFLDLSLLTKPRLNMLVLMAGAAGFLLGSSEVIHWLALGHALIGILLTGAGSSVLNQALEGSADGKMDRTKDRPLPAGRLSAKDAFLMGTLLVSFGTAYLVWTTTLITAGLALLTVIMYIVLYTPLKRKTPLNTLVGAFPGALPTLIGWSAAGKLDASAGTLFAILFLWQMPHFYAIAWLYRKDYGAGGFKMWPVVDPSGQKAGRLSVLYAFALLLIAWTPAVFGLTGWGYALGATVGSLVFIVYAIRFALERNDGTARSLFLASITYLFLILALMMLDKHAFLQRTFGF